MLAGVPAVAPAPVILRECAIAFALLMAFMLGGHKFLEVMRLSERRSRSRAASSSS